MTITNFSITNGTQIIGSLNVDGDKVLVNYESGETTEYVLTDIKSLELVQAEELDAKHTVTGGLLGAVLLGPFGAVAGASMGRLLRKCTFLVAFSDEKTIACQTMYKIYDNFRADLKLKGIKI